MKDSRFLPDKDIQRLSQLPRLVALTPEQLEDWLGNQGYASGNDSLQQRDN